jgi:hypothetical protein
MPLSFDGIFEVGVAAVANAFAGTIHSTVFNASLYKQSTWILHKAVGASGTTTVTIEACSDASATATSAIPFWYRKSTTLDTWGDLTQATTAGFTTTAGSNQLYEIVVDHDFLGGNDIGGTAYKYIRMTCVEVVASAVLGGVLVYLGQARYPRQTPAASALT